MEVELICESHKKVKDITVKLGSFRAATYMIISREHAHTVEPGVGV